jgi:ferredoxin-NADP reductase
MMTLPISRQAMLWEITAETFRIKSFLLHVAGCQGHLSGQHADIRLTAEDDYQAQRSHSIALPPDGQLLALTVARVEDVEVSPHLPAEVSAGGRSDLRGPMGGYFVWTATARSALSIAGGSGIVPLMPMFRHRDMIELARRPKEPTPWLEQLRLCNE